MASNKNELNFTGKVALITGGGAGIGRATSVRFAHHGAKVVIGDIDPAGAETANLIKREGGEAIFVQTDVREAKDAERVVAAYVAITRARSGDRSDEPESQEAFSNLLLPINHHS